MGQVFNIVKAWYRVAKNHTTKDHKRRMDICNKCSLAVYKKYTDFVDDELKSVKGFVCGGCGCPLIAKIRSDEDCPLKKW